MRRVLEGGSLLLAALCVACGGGDHEPEVTGSALDADSELREQVFSTCQSFAEAYCGNMAECCRGVHGAHDADACQDAFESNVCRPGADAVVAGQAEFDADAVEPCLRAYARAFDTCQADWDEVLTLREEIYRACRVIDGRTDPGGGCQLSITCRKPEGAATATCVNGTCRAIEVLERGDECEFPNGDVSVCATGLYCTAAGLDEVGVCAPTTELGSNCDPDGATNDCGLGNYCARNSETCQPADNFGGPTCDQHGECVSFSCDQTARECAPAAVVQLETCVGG